MTDLLDVAIVGAGAAGVAAARRLAGQGRAVLLVEALPRLGGRAHTLRLQDMPLDLGCAWLHSAERNPLAVLAQAEGRQLDRSVSAWSKQWRDIGFTPEQQRQAWQAYADLRDRLRNHPPASDCAGDAIAADHPWRAFLDALSGYINGAPLNALSVADFLAYANAESANNWRLPDGYGAFIADLAAGLPAALNTQVRAVAHGDAILLDTDRGEIRARAAIVTVSTAVLAAGAIHFTPALDDHLHAAAGLPLGYADKVFFSMADADAAPPETHLVGAPDRADTGSYYLRPFGRPLIECFLGGHTARALDDAGGAAAIAFAKEELRALLGADFVKALAPLTVTGWARAPTILGSYSHALPGRAGARAVLASPVSKRLCFAGEACSAQDFSTAHGAWQSGLAAADWIAAGLPA